MYAHSEVNVLAGEKLPGLNQGVRLSHYYAFSFSPEKREHGWLLTESFEAFLNCLF